MSFSFYYLEVKIETLMCDILGIHHSAGKCLSNGRCLCWWGWTGSGACYVDGGVYNNRIIVSVDLRWLKTVFATFQDVEFDGSL